MKTWMIVFIFAICNAVYADFSVISESWPENVPSSYKDRYKEEQDDYHKDILDTQNDKKNKRWSHFITQPQIPEENHYYAKFGTNFSESKIHKIKNHSSGVLSGLILSKDSTTNNRMGFEMGGGYSWKAWRIDLDYMFNRKVFFDQTTLFVGNTESLTSEVRSRGILVNLYYDFQNILAFKPYIGLATGLNWHRSKSTLSNGTVGDGIMKSESKIGLAWGLTVGARMRFWQRWMLHAGYRYAHMGKVLWKDNTGTMRLEGNNIFSGMTLGVIYLI